MAYHWCVQDGGRWGNHLGEKSFEFYFCYTEAPLFRQLVCTYNSELQWSAPDVDLMQEHLGKKSLLGVAQICLEKRAWSFLTVKSIFRQPLTICWALTF